VSVSDHHLEVVLGLGEESEFDVSNEWDFNVFLTVFFSEASRSAGSFLEARVNVLEDGLELFVDGSFSADTVVNLVKRYSNSWLRENLNFDVTDHWESFSFFNFIEGESLGGTSTFS
jgi:hypothetical protein